MKKIFIFLGLLLSVSVFSQTVYYVKPAGNDANGGTTWGTAFKTLQKALSTASSGQIWVAAGTYYPDEGPGLTNNDRSFSFNLKNNVALYGGFAGMETALNQRNWKTNVTTLSGDIDQIAGNAGNSIHVVNNYSLNNSAVLDGFAITGGNADPFGINTRVGGGMFNDASSPTIANCSFSGNNAYFNGGGMANFTNSSPRITNCSFSGNTASSANSAGGGIYNYYSSSPIITGCSFSANASSSTGGGLYNNYSSSPVVTNCIFSKNTAAFFGGANYNNYSSSPTFTNCIFFENKVLSTSGANSGGGALYNYSASNPSLINCSFFGNASVAPDVCIYNYGSSPKLTNCILWGNNSQIINYSLSNPVVSFSIVKGGFPGTGNLDQNPLFVNTAMGDLHLQRCSPAIDAGTPTGAPTTDMEGNARPALNGYDLGAYEYQGVPCAPPLIITSPGDFTINNDPGSCGAKVDFTGTHAATVSGGTGTVTITYAPASGSELPSGPTQVRATATDERGQAESCTFTVTIQDKEGPAFTAPINQNLAITQNCQVIIPNLIAELSGTDNCGGLVSFTQNHAMDKVLSVVPGALINVKITAQDERGNQTEKTVTLTAQDITPPLFTAPVDREVELDGNCSFTVPDLLNGLNVQDCDLKSLTQVPAAGTLISSSHGQVNEVAIRAVDGSNNPAEQKVKLTALDKLPPAFTPPAAIEVALRNDCTLEIPDLTFSLRGDAQCGTLLFSQGPEAGTAFHSAHNQPYTITITASDGHGNATSYEVTVTAKDQTAPVPDILVLPDATDECAITLTPPVATDNCGAKISATTEDPVSYREQGAWEVTWSYNDGHGNISNQKQRVVVKDKTPPVPDATSLPDLTHQCGLTVVTTPTATDNCSGKITGTTNDPLTYNKQGSYTIHWTFEDGYGNHAIQEQRVTIADVTAPTIVAPAALKQGMDPGKCYATVDLGTPQINDNCGVASVSNDAPEIFSKGVTTVTWTVADIHGLLHTATQRVEVVDDQKPTVATRNITVQLNSQGAAAITPEQINNGSTDNCSIPASGYRLDKTSFDCSNIGTNMVTLTVTDVNDNINSKTAVVTVEDNVKPTVLTKNITVQLDAQGKASITPQQIDNGSTDNCGIASLSLDKTSFTGANVGVNTVTLTATDGNNNSNTGTATVAVEDNVAPTVITQDITVALDANGQAVIKPEQINNGSKDNCHIPSDGYKLDITSFDCEDVGQNTVTLMVTDANGNSASSKATVTVVDKITPTITIPEWQKLRFLAPPNHKMVEVPLDYLVKDICLNKLTYEIAIKNNEEGISMWGNDSEEDYKIVDKHKVLLRAERSGTGEGRVYTITVTAKDVSGNVSTGNMEVLVSHNISSPVSGKTFKVGSTVALTGSFWDKAGNKHTGNWTIDGTTTVRGSVTEPAGRKNGTITGSYKFTAPGVYKLQMNVVDQTGVTTYANTNGELDAIVVIYDPNGGYTVGGGWFNSPAGAFTRNATAKGPVSFGFQSNYYKGATNPKGETQFEFKVGDLEFNALNFEYLAVDRAKAKAQFKGSGKIIGGQSGISFIMTVIDGALNGTGVDMIRMKIYNKNTGEVYYDSQPGASDAADPTTVVGTGSLIEIGAANTDVPLTVSPLAREVNQERAQPAPLQVTAIPNPSTQHFTLTTRSGSVQPLTVRILDNWGRVVDAKQGVAANGTLYIGSQYRPGIYFVEVVQGRARVVLKLVKQPD